MKSFRQLLIAIAIPVTLQSLLRSSLNLIDTIMVGQLGDLAIASVGIANQVYFLMNIFLLGITSGLSIFVSQFFGIEDYKSIKKVTGIAMTSALMITGLTAIIILFYSQRLLSLFTEDQAVIKLGSQYLRIVAWSFAITGITATMSTATRSTGKPTIPMTASFVGVGMNTFLNYCLIFGIGIFPELGVEGAAIATLIARVFEVIILLILVHHRHKMIQISFHNLINFDPSFIKKFVNESGIIVVKDIAWGFGITIYIAIYARISTESIAAINILNTIKSMAYVVMQGLAAGGIVMIGQSIGGNHHQQAYAYAKRIQKIGVGISLLIVIVVLLLRPLLLLPFNVTDAVKDNLMGLILVFALYFPFESYNMVSVMGILRSGADNLFCLKMDLVAVYCIGLVLAYTTGILLSFNIIIVLAFVSSQELFKSLVLYKRVNSKKWINNIIYDL